ncbi:ABC transporter permease subunit [Ferrimonas balearica]|uniref:ABC transporter permease subunit n=1 Tax=Ferrimonas balearica TaxID=44012 RepID=UPI001C9A132D|nr:ABC transporter permease subunit [Ferrimonas balearica]MBY5920176.1 ABC transporter permease subunit [Ferrimonas balearica]MBY5997139.1 ABC transporter permease subunit [Ferrimonas balearica]
MMTRSLRRLTGGVALVGLLCVFLGDLTLTRTEPLNELSRLGQGLLVPDFFATEHLAEALFATLAFALLGTGGGVALGAIIALFYHRWWVRGICAWIRAIHELFWALIFMQLFGLSGLTGVLALTLPFGAMFARVYSEILDQSPVEVERALPPQTRWLDRVLYARLAPMWPALKSYTRYRFECALRSSTVLGFIGLPTLGFYLETAYRQGYYAEGGALLWLFLLLIGTLRWWARPALLIPLGAAALYWLPDALWPDPSWLWHFLGQAIWPVPLLEGDLSGLLSWGQALMPQLWQGLRGTLLVSGLALALSFLFALLFWPWASRALVGRWRYLGQAGLLLGRSVPELLLAFVLVLVLGPSMLPAALALALHNGALVAFLTAREADRLPLRPDASRGANRHHYELLPRVYPGMTSLLMYRFESMVRETAMMGMLGIATLGFFVDSAFELFRYDEALALILVAGALNLLVEIISRHTMQWR